MGDRISRILALSGLSISKTTPATATTAAVTEENEVITDIIEKVDALHLLGGLDSKPEVAQWLELSKNMTASDLTKIDTTLFMKSYLVGYEFTVADAAIFEAIREKHSASVADFIELSRWFDHIQRICPSSTYKLLDLGAKSSHFMCLPPSSVAAPAVPAQKAVVPAAAPTAAAAAVEGKQEVALSAPTSSAAAATAPAAGDASVTTGEKVEKQEKQQKKEKKEKKVDESAAAAPAPAESDELDPSKLDIRVGVVVKCWNHPDSDKLLCEEINLGEAAIRTIASGIRPHYAAEDLVGRKVCVLANLKDRNLAGFKSQGMVLCAVSADHTVIKLLEAPAESSAGDRITFPGFTGDAASSAQMAKKKILEKLASGLRTDSAGVAHWAACPFTVDAGVCIAHDKLGDAIVS